MITILKSDKFDSDDWLSLYYRDFRRRVIKLLAKVFQSFTTGLALSLLDNKAVTIKNEREYKLNSYFIKVYRLLIVLSATSNVRESTFNTFVYTSALSTQYDSVYI